MNRLVTAHIADLEVRGLSLSLRKSSLYALGLLMLYLRETHGVTDWRAVTPSHLHGFLSHLQSRHRTRRGKPLKPATLSRWLSSVRSFFAWQHQHGHLLYDPAQSLISPQQELSLPRILSEADVTRMIETPDTGTAVGLRDRALMEVLYATGIRHGEAHRLDLYDVDVRARRLTVRLGKGKRDRIMPLTDTAASWLMRYLNMARPKLARGQGKGQPAIIPSPALWLSVTGRRLSYAMIEQRIKGYAATARVKANVHTFRHCYATHLLRGGASVRHVQQLLGHARLDTTAIYTHLTTDDLRGVVERLPQSSFKPVSRYYG
jgi:integrase/recombinase XerD